MGERREHREQTIWCSCPNGVGRRPSLRRRSRLGGITAAAPHSRTLEYNRANRAFRALGRNRRIAIG